MAYEVHLSQFDGPLDLLLHLIEEAEVDIKDIFVSQITAQYLSYMDAADDLDMDTASEFLTMAATLVYIKSRSLLPAPPAEDAEEEDPEVVLIRQLREYKAFKEASERLETLRTQAAGAFCKLPEEFLLPPQEYTLLESDMESLYEAFLTVLSKEHERVGAAPVGSVENDRYTVRTQLKKIRAVLAARKEVQFTELFADAASKLEMIVTFMALMDMLTHNEITVSQSRPFDPITICVDKLLEDDADIEYMDE